MVTYLEHNWIEFMSLTRQDWLEAARHLMTEKGVGGVKVEVLARILKVSKGSFYWHFKDRKELLSELLSYWASITDELISHAKQAKTPEAQLSTLFAAIEASGVSGEEVIQVWAQQDSEVAKVVHEVEKKRMEYLTEIFVEGGFGKARAKERAEITYLTYLGYAFKNANDSAFSLKFSTLGKEIVNLMFERTKK